MHAVRDSTDAMQVIRTALDAEQAVLYAVWKTFRTFDLNGPKKAVSADPESSQ